MGFAILRTQKLKSAVAVRRSMTHAFREQDTPNADPQRGQENTHIGAASMAEALAIFNATLPAKHRKDAVQCIEYLVTASPDAMNAKDRVAQDRYFADALDWLKGRHGDDNVVYAGIHRDESTPHMYAFVVPRDPDTGNLNCRRWLGGAKALSKMQTEFAERVGQQHGFRRGIEHSRAKHTTIREFYGALQTDEVQPAKVQARHVTPQVVEKRLLAPDVREVPQAVADRLTRSIEKHYAPALAEASTARLARRKAVEATRTAESKAYELEVAKASLKLWEQAYGGLTKEQHKGLAAAAAKHRGENALVAEAQRRVDQLAELVKRGTGAVLTFAQHAVDAIKAKAGAWRQVNWVVVEAAVEQEAVHVNQQSLASTKKAITEHSPRWVGTPKAAIDQLIERAAHKDRLAHIRPQAAERAPDRGGPGPGR